MPQRLKDTKVHKENIPIIVFGVSWCLRALVAK